MIKKKCIICGKDFEIHSGRIGKRTTRTKRQRTCVTCSKKCSSIHRLRIRNRKKK